MDFAYSWGSVHQQLRRAGQSFNDYEPKKRGRFRGLGLGACEGGCEDVIPREGWECVCGLPLLVVGDVGLDRTRGKCVVLSKP